MKFTAYSLALLTSSVSGQYEIEKIQITMDKINRPHKAHHVNADGESSHNGHIGIGSFVYD